MEKKLFSVIIGIAVIGLILSQSLYTVYETQTAIVLQLGEPKQDNVGPGLHFKLPFIQNVIKFDARVLTYDSKPAEALTKDKKTIVIDNYARWRIVRPLDFYKAMRSVPVAQSRLVDIVYAQLRVVVGQYDLDQVVNAPSPEKLEEEKISGGSAADDQFVDTASAAGRTGGRLQVMDEVIRLANQESMKYGIEIVDVRIKRIDLPAENQRAIFERMQAERKRQAQQYRSEGTKEAMYIRSSAQREAQVMLANAQREAEIMRGQADAQAMDIFTNALKQSPEFYEFSRSLEAYKKAFKENSRVVLPVGSEFLKYFE